MSTMAKVLYDISYRVVISFYQDNFFLSFEDVGCRIHESQHGSLWLD